MLRPGVRRGEDAAALELGLRRLDEVGGAADHRRRVALERLHHLRAGVARRDLLARLELRQRLDPARPRLAGVHLVPVLAQAPGTSPTTRRASAATPPRARCRARVTFMCSRTSSGTTNFSSGSQPSASFVARTSSSPSGEPCDFAVSTACGAPNAMCERTTIERRPLGLRLRVRDRLAQQIEVVRVVDVLHVPALRLEPLRPVLGERDRRRAVDRDVVVVVEVDELAEPERAGDRRRLVRDAFHQVAVGRRCSRRGGRRSRRTAGCSARRGTARRSPKPTPFAKPWPSGPGRHLDARRVMHLRMARRLRLPLPEALQLLEREVVAGEVQRRVLEDARVAGAEDEAVAVGPLRVRRVVVHHLRVEEVRERRERHRRARMAGVRLLHRVHRERADGVDRELFDVSVRHEAPRRAAAAVPAPNDMPLPAPPAGGTPRRAAPRPARARAAPASRPPRRAATPPRRATR